MGFVYSKGYLVHADLEWDADEFLVGSEYVNAVVHWMGADGARYGAFATNADLVVIRLDTNAPHGFARLAGGFAKVARCGDDLYAISNSDPAKIYRVAWTAMSGGADATPADWAPEIEADVGATFADVHGCTYDGGAHRVLGWTGDDGNTATLWFRALPDGDLRALEFGPNSRVGFFPAGDHDNTLYYAIGSRVHAIHNPHAVAGDVFVPDASVGAIADDFAGDAIDGRSWMLDLTPGATLAQNNGLEFALSNSGPLREAAAYFLQSCPGDIGVRAKYAIDEEPAPVGDEYTEVIVGLVTLGGATQYLHVRRRTASGVANRMEVWHGGALVYAHDATTYATYPWIAVDRYRDGDDVKIRISASNDADDPVSWSTIRTHIDPDGDDTSLLPALSATNTCVAASEFLRGRFEHFRARDTSSAHYRVRRTSPLYHAGLLAEDITAAAVSARSVSGSDPRAFALVFGDVNAKVQVVRLDHGAYDGALARESVVSNTVGTATSGAAIPVIDAMQAIRCVAVSDNRASIVVGGSTGARQIDTSDIAHDINVLPMRSYTTAWDHAQPLVDAPVWCVDWRGSSFIYGCRSDADPLYGDAWGYGYGYAGHADGGGAGQITPDFAAPLGANAWAESTHDTRAVVRTGARSPQPIPADYLHAHIERRIEGGAWQRLRADGWETVTDGAWDHSLDVAFPAPDGEPADAYTIIQDTQAAPGRHEYRWVFHDEAGNAGLLAAQTLYGDRVEYRGAPEVTAIAIDEGGAVATARGVHVTVAASSGAQAGDVDGAVWQARVWNDGEAEHASPWRDWPAGAASAAFAHLLTAGAGLKTVHARVRHVSGETSASVGASIVLVAGTALAAADGAVARVMIAHGDEGPFAFTGDRGRVFTNSAAAGFPVSNVRANDLGTAWKSDGLGDRLVMPDGILYRAELVFDLILARNIDLVALLGHNFADISSLSGLRDMSVRLAACDDSSFSGASLFSVDLSGVATRPLVAHRPGVSRRWWRVRTEARFDADPARQDTPWTIGRVILNEATMCFTPSHNYSQRIGVAWTDPSPTTATLGQARRAVDLASYRRVDLVFADLTPDETQPFETIWRRHRQVKPVLVVLDPTRLSQGTDAPHASGEADDPARDVIYGYLGASLRREGSGWNHADVRLAIDESVG
ncbi:MAG: hypothetical protein IT350_02480 [Deltaproteobacteria bacterium]|nr:hypothetical protein [Deltaproteobacteria bacterium]